MCTTETVVQPPLPCRVAFETGPGSHYWGQLFQLAGVQPKTIPTQLGSLTSNRTRYDFNDASSIAEASRSHYTPLKYHEPLASQATHCIGQRFDVGTPTVNRMRALLEYGLTVLIENQLSTLKFELRSKCASF